MKSRHRKVIPGHGFQAWRAYRSPERIGMVCAEPECPKLARLHRSGAGQSTAALPRYFRLRFSPRSPRQDIGHLWALREGPCQAYDSMAESRIGRGLNNANAVGLSRLTAL